MRPDELHERRAVAGDSFAFSLSSGTYSDGSVTLGAPLGGSATISSLGAPKWGCQLGFTPISVRRAPSDGYRSRPRRMAATRRVGEAPRLVLRDRERRRLRALRHRQARDLAEVREARIAPP